MKKRRTAETLVEIVTAMTLFGVIMSGLFDFMANQTINLAHVRQREKIMYYAQKWMSYEGRAGGTVPGAAEEGITFTSSGNILTVSTTSGASMQFSLE